MRRTPIRGRLFVTLIALAAIGAAAFKMSLGSRIERIYTTGTTLAYYPSMSPPYLDYADHIFDGWSEQQTHTAQQLVPPGAPVVVWINLPFFLDYARNPIIDVEGAGLCTAWARIPQAKYFIWDYTGFPTFKPGDLGFMFNDEGEKHRLRGVRMRDAYDQFYSLLQTATVLYADGRLVVFRTGDRATTQETSGKAAN